MTVSTRKAIAAGFSVILLTLSAFVHADPVERVVSFDVSNSRAQLAGLDTFFSSELMRGQKATLWAPMFSGSGNSNRTLVIEYDSFEELAEGGQVFDTPEFMRLQQATDGTAKVVGNRMAAQSMVDGSGWSEHGAMLAVPLTVSDPATYAAAFAEMIRSVDNPGSIRLMQMRYGGEGVTHVVLISAPDAVAANNYAEELLGSDAFREFAAKVADIRKVHNFNLMRRVQSWNN